MTKKAKKKTPYKRPKQRALTPQESGRIRWTKDREAAFLKAYAECGRVMKACSMVGIDPNTVRSYRKKDEAFNALYHEAEQKHRDMIYNKIVERGVHGFEKPLVKQGQLTGEVVTEVSDNLLTLLARAKLPEFADSRTVTNVNKVEGHVVHEHQINLQELSRDKREQMRLFLEEGTSEAVVIEGETVEEGPD